MNTQWDVSVPDSTLAAYVDDALAPLLNGKKEEKPASAAEVKHLAPGEERTRRHTMPSIPSCAELFVSVTDVRIVHISVDVSDAAWRLMTIVEGIMFCCCYTYFFFFTSILSVFEWCIASISDVRS